MNLFPENGLSSRKSEPKQIHLSEAESKIGLNIFLALLKLKIAMSKFLLILINLTQS